ncbi:MAG: hypothetical protein GY866_25430, partial [Proteobacteria bacterium]|nr:hypothetical protein [Pseudomonadota bacterium]
MKHTVACGFLVLLSLVFVFRISSQEIQTHRSKVTVPILENDIAYAKNNAFQTLQKHLLSLAIKDLIGDLLYDEYRKQILLNESLNPKYYLVSVKVLKEHSGAGSFTMELEGKIQMDILAEALRKMNLVFKSDSWVPVSLVVEDGIDISMEDFESRLGLFHLKIDEADTIDFSEFPWDEYPSRDRADKEFIEKLFEQYSGNKIVYLIEAERYNAYSEVFGDVFADPYSFETDDVVGDIQALRLKILRKSDLEQVNALSMKISPPISPKSEDFNDRLNRVFQKFLALLSIQSLKKSSYDVGTGSIINLEIVGLATPLHRSFFEEEILKRNRSVKFFLLTKLSTHSIQYKIRSKISLPSLIEDFREENPYFDFEVESDEFNTLKLLAIGKPTENASDMPDWEPKTDIIIGIGKAILNKSSFMEKAMIRTDLSEEDIPLLVEKEPNNSSRTFNKLPPSMLAVGRIDRRGDEDIYQLEGLPQKPELEIDDQSQDYVDLFEPRFPNFSLEIAVSDQEIAGQEGIETLKDIGIKEDPTGDQEIENEEDRIKEDPTGDQEIENEEDRIKEDPTGDQKIENEEGRIK